jgi:hypothetical protein
MEGLLLLGTFLVGFNNHERWLWSGLYLCLPLFIIGFFLTFFSLFSKSMIPYRRQVKPFFFFNLIGLIFLAAFVYWGYGGALTL